MTLEKAIEIKERKGGELFNTSPAEMAEADRLSFEALKVINRHSFTQRSWEGKLLPDETED